MTTPSERWSAETEELVARAVAGRGVGGGLRPESEQTALAKAALTALADAGLLQPPGGKTRQEWGYRYRGFCREWTPVQPSTRELAERDARDFLEVFAKAGGEAEVVRRVVHEGPWVAVSEP